MKTDVSPTIKYIITPALGFGIAGVIWGIEAFRGTVGSGETFTNPFSYILGAVAFGILGSLSLVIFSGDIKKIIKVVTVGLVGWIIAFLLPAIWGYSLFLFGGIAQPIFFLISYISGTSLTNLLNLQPSMLITGLWLEFLFTGAIVGSAGISALPPGCI